MLGSTKQICRLLNSRRADAHLHVFFYVLHKINIIQWYVTCIWAAQKTKPASHTPEYTLLHIWHQHTWSIHKSYIFKIIQNIANHFSWFLKVRLLNFVWIPWKINAHKYYNFLQYTTNPEISQCILILTWAIIYNYNNYDNNEIKNEHIIKRMNKLKPQDSFGRFVKKKKKKKMIFRKWTIPSQSTIKPARKCFEWHVVM